MASKGLTYEVTSTAEEITVRLVGEFDLASAIVFQHDILPLLSEGHTRAVIDLSGLTFLDSTVVDRMLKLSGLETELD